MSSMKSMCHFFFLSFSVFLERDVSCCCCCCYFFVFLILVKKRHLLGGSLLIPYRRFYIDQANGGIRFLLLFCHFDLSSTRHLLGRILLTIPYPRSYVDRATGGIRVAAHVAIIGVPADVSFSSAPEGKPRGRGFSRGFSRGRGR